MCIHTSLSSWACLPPSCPTPLSHYRAQSWAPLYSSFLLASYRQSCLNGISSQARIQFRIMHCISLPHLPFLLQRGGLCNKKMSQTPGYSFQPWDLAPSLSSTRVCCVHRVCPPPLVCLVTHSYPTLCDPIDCSLLGFFVHGNPPGKNTGVGCHAFLQGFFPSQGSNPGLLHCRQILYQPRKQGFV